MQDVRIDEAGEFRCWKCGGKQFTRKRTFRAKAAVGVGALLTHKKLKCLACGEYNQTGDAKPFDPATVGKMLGDSPAAVKSRRQEADTALKAEIVARRKAAGLSTSPWAVGSEMGKAKTAARQQAKRSAQANPGS